MGKLKNQICGFWQRIFAFSMDGVILFISGLILCGVLSENPSSLSFSIRILFYVLSVLYFGLMNSELNDGQTPGKRFFKIRLENRNGGYVGVVKSIFRSAFALLPFLLFRMDLPAEFAAGYPLIPLYMNIILTIVSSGILFFYLANTNSRQSLHDMIFGTFVVKDYAFGPVAIRTRNVRNIITFVFLSILILVFYLYIAPGWY